MRRVSAPPLPRSRSSRRGLVQARHGRLQLRNARVPAGQRLPRFEEGALVRLHAILRPVEVHLVAARRLIELRLEAHELHPPLFALLLSLAQLVLQPRNLRRLLSARLESLRCHRELGVGVAQLLVQHAALTLVLSAGLLHLRLEGALLLLKLLGGLQVVPELRSVLLQLHLHLLHDALVVPRLLGDALQLLPLLGLFLDALGHLLHLPGQRLALLLRAAELGAEGLELLLHHTLLCVGLLPNVVDVPLHLLLLLLPSLNLPLQLLHLVQCLRVRLLDLLQRVLRAHDLGGVLLGALHRHLNLLLQRLDLLLVRGLEQRQLRLVLLHSLVQALLQACQLRVGLLERVPLLRKGLALGARILVDVLKMLLKLLRLLRDGVELLLEGVGGPLVRVLHLRHLVLERLLLLGTRIGLLLARLGELSGLLLCVLLVLAPQLVDPLLVRGPHVVHPSLVVLPHLAHPLLVRGVHGLGVSLELAEQLRDLLLVLLGGLVGLGLQLRRRLLVLLLGLLQALLRLLLLAGERLVVLVPDALDLDLEVGNLLARLVARRRARVGLFVGFDDLLTQRRVDVLGRLLRRLQLLAQPLDLGMGPVALRGGALGELLGLGELALEPPHELLGVLPEGLPLGAAVLDALLQLLDVGRRLLEPLLQRLLALQPRVLGQHPLLHLLAPQLKLLVEFVDLGLEHRARLGSVGAELGGLGGIGLAVLLELPRVRLAERREARLRLLLGLGHVGRVLLVRRRALLPQLCKLLHVRALQVRDLQLREPLRLGGLGLHLPDLGHVRLAHHRELLLRKLLGLGSVALELRDGGGAALGQRAKLGRRLLQLRLRRVPLRRVVLGELRGLIELLLQLLLRLSGLGAGLHRAVLCLLKLLSSLRQRLRQLGVLVAVVVPAPLELRRLALHQLSLGGELEDLLPRSLALLRRARRLLVGLRQGLLELLLSKLERALRSEALLNLAVHRLRALLLSLVELLLEGPALVHGAVALLLSKLQGRLRLVRLLLRRVVQHDAPVQLRLHN
mmetsp:Transcript_22165/g.54604  ORF Transcript_22165/g.54604 Transcript_22165/m.54604 type:complete len:1018 (+) Transcript_22165:445-3498(+)